MDGREEVLADNIAFIRVHEDGIEAFKVTGEKFSLKGYRIGSIDFLGHKVYLVRAD